MTNIKIKNVAIYHPENLVANEFYLEHFKEQGEDVTGFLTSMGRNKRYIIDNEENSLSMGIEAAKRVLAKAQLTGKDIDMIVFSTQVPEHTLPTNAMFVHHEIDGANHTMMFDSNANCAGMTVAVENASHYMMSNRRINRALIIGSDANSLISNPEQAFTYANFSDAAAAVILEKTADEDTGFIDAVYEVDSANRNNIIYPKEGFSQTIGKKEHIVFTPFDGAMAIPVACEMIEKLLKDNGLKIEDVNSFCLSQFALSNILKIQNHFNIPEEKIIYVGDRYGYTSTSSPFICLHEGIETGSIKRGDIVLFWTIGAGHEMVAMLFKY
ncbi:ketoacyl-ACP synthase III [Solibacillus sp. FSL W7-1464]|uniref:ketoacyl-ACP synthase III n=1 Tax=Solibacillus sp. FSL W7-1464 TaxID=2921706 RepID=UPI0030FCBEBD